MNHIKWDWGVELDPQNYTPPEDNLPRIQGRAVIWIPDIRNAPGGSNFKHGTNEINGSELAIRVVAATTDQFILYLEERALEGYRPTLLAGMHLDTSGRQEEAELKTHVLKFQLPFDKNVYIEDLVLLPLNECPLSAPPSQPLSLTLSQVEKLQENYEPEFTKARGKLIEGKIRLIFEHAFPVTGFKLEYEAVQFPPSLNILHAALFAISHHKSQDCTCFRKEKIESVVEIDLAQLCQEIPKQISVLGLRCARTNLPSLAILTT